MLASTVQFSRYGRSRFAHLRIRGGANRSEGRQAPVPSGPNSVLGQAVTATTLPPRNGDVLTGLSYELTE